MNKGRYFANVNAETVYYFNERIKKMFFFDVYSNFWKEYKKYLIWNFKTSLVIIETSKKIIRHMLSPMNERYGHLRSEIYTMSPSID